MIGNRFKTVAEIANVQNNEVIPHALQVYEYIVTETALGTEYYKKGADGVLVPEDFFGITPQHD